MATAEWKKYASEKLADHVDPNKVKQIMLDRTRKAIDDLQTHYLGMQSSRPEGIEFYRGAEFALKELKTSLHI